ncbi:MAG: hypothetical protein ABSH48_16180 [Verrucomicrobiota bacterium]
MKIKHLAFTAIAALALNSGASAQNVIGVGAPTETTRNDTYIGAGFEFYAPLHTGTTINALGFWDANGTGLLTAHTVSIFKYDGSFNPSGYDLVATATIPAGTVAPLIDGYRWVGIPTTVLPDSGQDGGYYAILATEAQDTWAGNSYAAGQYMNPAIGTVTGYGIIRASDGDTVLSSQAVIYGDINAGDGYAGPNLAFLTTSPPAQPGATPILWIAQGVFTDDTVLNVAGASSNEVYGVDFGGSGLQTTTNGYTFNDYTTTGNMTLSGGSGYSGYLGGGGTTGDANFDTVLNSGVYGDDTIYGVLQNLTIGQKYNVLAVETDTRGSTGITFAFTDDLGFSPAQTFTFPGGTPDMGGYIEGTFTATGTNQVFSMESSHVQYNAILLEKVPAGEITLVTNTLPTSASVATGSNIVFTAAYSNSPAVKLQWQQIIIGSPSVTNNINAGVVTLTNNGNIIYSTLTLNKVQVSNAGSYRLEAIDVANSANVAYSASAPLTVIPLITWYAAGTYNGTFSDNTVLAYAGTVASEVYGVDFGGSGAQTTANGYTFDDYATSGNMSVADNPSSYGGYMTGGATTGDPALDTMLTDGVYGQTQNTGTLNNLTVGQTYTVLVLVDDTRGAAAGGSVFHVTDGVTLSPGQPYAFANGSPKVGGYIMGTFTAQATTQPLTILTVLGAASQYNVVLLEKGIAPPPPVAPILGTDIAPLQSEVPVGAPMTFSVVASGALPLHYQWSNQGGSISGATNSSYLFNALAGANSYQVSISNVVGTIVSSTAVVLGLTNPPPLITFDDTNWALNNNGSITPSIETNQLTLTDGNANEASSAFYDVGQYIGGFVASFTYQTSGGGDGVTFCLQNASAGTNALGQAGASLGYSGIAPSVAFEMNIYPGPITAPAHGGAGIRVGTNGAIGDFSNEGYIGTGLVNFTNGDNIYVQLYYQQGVMQVLMIDPTAPATNTSTFFVNVPAVVGNDSAYVGFTGSDSGVTSVQTVSNFLYSYTTPPIVAIGRGAPGRVVVSWPVSVSSLFTLVQSGTLAGPWSPAVPVSSAVVGLQNQVTLSAGGSLTFYRLQLNDPNAP